MEQFMDNLWQFVFFLFYFTRISKNISRIIKNFNLWKINSVEMLCIQRS